MEGNAAEITQKPINVDVPLARATLYRALALGFRPPAAETLGLLLSKEGAAVLADAAALLDPNREWNLAVACSRLAVHNPERTAGSLHTLTAAHRRLFGHTARGAVPPYETEYGSEALFQQPQELGDLMGFYAAFGLTTNPAEHERPDHISCECEFLSFLSLKEAYAIEHRDGSMLEETRKAARLFLRDHPGRFLPAFAKGLAREGRDGFYAALGELCLGLVALECARADLTLGSPGLELRPAIDDRVPLACGSGAECAAMPGAGVPEGMEE
jgi:TorA maturation chaperone TorD